MKIKQSINLVFTSGNQPFEWLVRIGTLSPTSHAAVAIGDDLLHVHDAGVVFEPRGSWLAQDQRLIAEYKIIPDVSDSIDLLKAQIGMPYDAVGAALIVARRALMHAKSSLALVPGRVSAQTCAAFVMQLDDGSKIPEWTKIRRDVVAPADLLRACEYGPSFERIA